MGLLFTSVPGVQAACEIGGQVVDAANALVAGDNLVCNDIDLVEPIQANENGVTITFGDGNGAADTTLTLDATDARDAITVQSDSTVTINADAAITAPNSASAGIFAIGDNNTITVNGGTIDVADDGLQANGSNNTLTMNGGSIVAGNEGIQVRANNTVIINNGSVKAGSEGFNKDGIFADGGSNAITINGGSVSASTQFASGIDVRDGNNQVTVSGGAVDASGANAQGISATGGGNRITLSGGTVSATGENGQAVEIIVGDLTVDTVILGTGAKVTGALFATNEDNNDGSVILRTGTAALVLNGDGNGVFNDNITGFNILTKQDSGRFALGGTITGTGTINIDAGILAINGDASASLININAGGTLGGIGTVGTTTVGNGATLAAGNSIGTLTVNDALTFNTGSLMEVEIDAAGNVDLVQATGDIRIDGGTVRILSEWTGAGADAASILNSSFTFLTAGGAIAGDFDALDVVDDFAFLDGALNVAPTAVSLVYERNNIAFADLAETDNQKAAAAAAESAGLGNDLFDTVVVISEAEAAETFAALSSDAHASVQGVLIQDSSATRNLVMSELGGILSGQAPPAAGTATYGYRRGNSERGLTVWGGAYGTISSLDSDGNAAAVDAGSGGFLVGVGKTRDNGVHAGLFAGYGRSDISVDDQAFDADADIFTLGAYAGRQKNRLRLQLGAAYSFNDLSTERDARGGPFDETLKADYNIHTAQAFSELGYRFDTALATLEPFAGLAHVALFNDGFTEDTGLTALTTDSQTEAVTYSNLGIRLERAFQLGSTKARAHGLAGWQHAFGDTTPSLEQTFIAGGDSFTVSGAPIAKDALLLEAGMDFQFTGRATLGVGYNGRLGDGNEQHNFSARFSLKY